ncbi:MAG TPA: YciI family protein [Gaiellaceae bacterium]|jgi:uncharacterized protein YciI|nr:YciI family protein [Gaiellaceae bacterium]
MELDRFTIALLTRPADGPQPDEAAAAALQDAHLGYLAHLHETGALLAAGPVAGDRLRGLSILGVEPERALALKRQDPAVRAGLYAVEALQWRVPAGAVRFGPARFPRSAAEATR